MHESINIGVEKINNRLRRLNIFLMDELKLFGKSEDQIDSLVQTVQLLSEDIRMEFVLKKCSVLSGDKGMKLSTVGVE